jgi:hypothetical protein
MKLMKSRTQAVVQEHRENSESPDRVQETDVLFGCAHSGLVAPAEQRHRHKDGTAR